MSVTMVYKWRGRFRGEMQYAVKLLGRLVAFNEDHVEDPPWTSLEQADITLVQALFNREIEKKVPRTP